MKNLNLLIIIFLILVIGCFSLFLFKRKITESFDASSVILQDCNSGLVPKDGGECVDYAWSRNPKYFCGICGDSEKNPLYSVQSGENTLFGCSQFTSNNYGLSWTPIKGQQAVNTYFSDVSTCNSYNINANTNLFIYVCCDNEFNMTVGESYVSRNDSSLGAYNFNNITYGTEVTINGKNTSGDGGICVSYVWNGQLFILDNNGYTNSANIIDYVVTGDDGWDDRWKDKENLLPWMTNWIKTPKVHNTYFHHETKKISLTFKVGYSKNMGNITNDLVLFIGMNQYGTVSLNNHTVYTTSSSQANTMTQTTLSNVQENSKLSISGISSSSGGSLGLFYIWCGLLYCIPCNNTNFNNASVLISYTSTNINNSYIDSSNYAGNVQFLNNWLSTPANITFTFTTTVVSPNADIKPSWGYKKSSNTWITLTKNTLIGDWSVAKVNTNSNMTFSFWINITSINSNWSSILHVSNQNEDSQQSGDRVPGLWIESNTSQFYLAIDTESKSNTTYGSKSLPLNTDTFVTYVFLNQSVSLYINGQLESTYTLSSPIVSAKFNAKFYLGDPWYYTGNFKIKDFAIFNQALNSSQVSKLYSNALQQ
jgi:hypothetical protein